MKRIILIILALTLVVISCKKKDDEITGPGSGNKPPTNYEPPKVNTPEAQAFKKSITTYSGAEIIDELNSTYTFDANGDVSVDDNDSSGSSTYKFWGADPNNANIGWYYGENGNYPKTIEFYTDIRGRNNIKEAYDDRDKAESMMYGEVEVKMPDKSKIKPAKTDTEDATAWKSSVSNSMKGYYDSDDAANFAFDGNKNLTITYKVYSWDNDGNKMTDTGKTKTNALTFWGATKGSDNITVCGLYYKYERSSYNSEAFVLNTGTIRSSYVDNADTLMHPEKTVIDVDHSQINPVQITTANAKAWLEKIKGQTIESRNVEEYKILNSGDIEHNDNGEKTTYTLFGANNETNAIYSYKINLRELAGSLAPNETVYYYAGLILDTTKNEVTIESGFSDEYYNKLEGFKNLYYDENTDEYKENTDWKKFPLPKSTDIDWDSGYGEVVKNLIKK